MIEVPTREHHTTLKINVVLLLEHMLVIDLWLNPMLDAFDAVQLMTHAQAGSTT